MRRIESAHEVSSGLLVVSDDGNAYLLSNKSPNGELADVEDTEDFIWVPLPPLPQEGYVDPKTAEADHVTKVMAEMREFFTKLPEAIKDSHPHLHAGRDGMREPIGAATDIPCPKAVKGCEFRGSVVEISVHMQQRHGL